MNIENVFVSFKKKLNICRHDLACIVNKVAKAAILLADLNHFYEMLLPF